MDGEDNLESIPFWNVNVPREQWTETCPSYLLGLDDWSRAHLSTRDEDYPLMSWQEVQAIINENSLQDFRRIPSQLHKYLKYIKEQKAAYGSIMNMIMIERLKWTDTVPKDKPFENPDDLKILYNDWPYGVDHNIVHLVVWVKFAFEEGPHGDLTPVARNQIEEYVQRTLCTRHDRSQLEWFRNWSALKSIEAVEHFHVMLYDPDPEFLKEITNHDCPISLTQSA